MKNFDTFLDEEVKYKKKKKKLVPKKADHKHTYVDVIVVVSYKNKNSYRERLSKGKECSICGKVVERGVFTVKETGLWLNDIDAVKALNPDLKVVKVER